MPDEATPTQQETIEPASTDQNAGAAQVAEEAASAVDADDDPKGNREAAKYRRQLREVEAERSAMSEGGRRGGIRSGQTRRSLPPKPTPEGSIEQSRAEQR